MSRVAHIDPSGAIAEGIRTRRGGELRPLDKVLLHSPPLASGWNSMLGAVRRDTTLPDDARETVILTVAVINGADYEWDAHRPVAVAAGMTRDQIEYLRAPVGASPLTVRQAVAFEFTDALTRSCTVPVAIFERARAEFGVRGVVELAVTVGAYNMVSRVLTALDVGEPGVEAIFEEEVR
jgi:alkylhydroperoxidase family enzyme